jgi:hypothetical protein
MITVADIIRNHYPEIGNRAILDAHGWQLMTDPIRWGVLHILDDYRGNIRLAAFVVTLLI